MTEKPTYAELEQMVEELRKSEKQKQIILNASVDMVMQYDTDLRIVWANKTATSMVNKAAHDIAGHQCYKIFQNRDTHCPGCPCLKALETGNVENKIMHYPAMGVVGESYWNNCAVPIKNDSGQIVELAEIARNITHKVLAEQSLRESEAKHRLLAENTVDCIWQMNLDLKFTYINQAIFPFLGYTTKEWIGSKLSEHCSSEETEKIQAIITDVSANLQNKTASVFEMNFYHKNGEKIPCEVSGKAILDDAGNPIYFQGTTRNITKRKKAEEEKLKLEAQLHLAQKMEAIGKLAGGVAHDFNNILTVVMGNAGLALMEIGKDDALRQEIEEIRKAGERAVSLTRQLLAFSRKQIVQPKILDINELLTDMEKMLGRLIGEDIEMLTIPAPALWQVEIDPGQIEQVIMNLAINAKDAMPCGGKLTIETANADLDENYSHEHGIEEKKSGCYVMLAVSDTGIGMDKETHEHIFEPFFTTKKVGKGTGLGLATVYGIVKQNNGFIWVYSEPKQGATFKVYLPEVKKDADPEKKEKKPVVKLAGSETVLIVEDDGLLRNLAQNTLQRYGYKVLDAENGENAIRICKEYDGRIDLMITDVVMPKIGGREAAKRLLPLYPQMKVIYMSGYTDDAIVHHGVLEPGLNFLEKPFTPKGLTLKVREVLDE
ncbi:MAG: PAS domain S-box protein [Thermodesulfobacteriota bacterium]|nr:PAS domain S-box protein [Thermodesulfobacteriota bacterium]